MILSRHVRFADLIKLTRCTCLVRPVLLAPASGSTHMEGGSVYAPTVAARAPRLRASGVLPIVIEPRGTPPRVAPYPWQCPDAARANIAELSALIFRD